MPDNRNEQLVHATHEGNQQDHRPQITVSVPVINEEGNVGPQLEKFRAVADKESCYCFEFLFTEYASTSQSTRPLRLITMFGFSISFLMFFTIFYFPGLFLFLKQGMPSGFTTIVFLALASIGLNSFFPGLLGEYVGRVFNNTHGLPISIIEQRIEPLGYNAGVATGYQLPDHARKVQHPREMQS